ncbi:MAG: hypothetical protein MHPSP_001893, partial [Paramarteilia canceri]
INNDRNLQPSPRKKSISVSIKISKLYNAKKISDHLESINLLNDLIISPKKKR